MEVRELSAKYLTHPGYKQTEIGLLPEDWDLNTFGQLYSEPSRNGIYKTSEFHGRGTRIVNMGEMFGFEFISDQEMSRVALSTRELSASGLRDGDLLFGRRSVVPSGAGKCSLVVSPPEPIAFESSIIRVRLENREAHPRFYYYFFASPTGRFTVGAIVSGTNVKGIRASELRELNVPRPTKTEQEAIAEALSDADAFIESLEQLLAKKRHLKQGAMQELLTGKKRLPGFSGEWEVKRLGDVTDTDPENLGCDTRPNFGFNYIALEDVDVGTLRSYSEQVFQTAPSRARRKLRKDDILVSTVRPNLMSHLLFSFMGDQWVCSTGFCVVRCREFVTHPPYVYFHMFAGGVVRQIEALLTGSNYPAINSGDVRALQIPIPCYEEQVAIAAILTDMDAEVATLEAKLAKARSLKQGMMQELLTGKIRLV